jgi:hypothetical protein
MAKSEEIELQKAFAKPGSKLRFRKLVGPKRISDKEVEEIVSLNDDLLFLENLQQSGQPVFETGWGALHHGASGSFELYYFDGYYFASLRTDWSNNRAGPFKKPLEAAERFSGIFEFEYGEEHGTSGAIQYSTNWADTGRGRITDRMAEKMFAELTGLAGSPLSFHWCEAKPGKLFKDPFHDEMGKALLQLHEATKSGNLDQLALAQAKLEGPKKTPIQSDHVLGDEAQYFTSVFDSFLMKVPLGAKGKLMAYETEWVRLCLPKRVGKKTFVAVMPIENPEGLIDDFVPVPTDDDKE